MQNHYWTEEGSVIIEKRLRNIGAATTKKKKRKKKRIFAEVTKILMQTPLCSQYSPYFLTRVLQQMQTWKAARRTHRQRRRAVVLHSHDERVLLLPLAVGRRRPRHHLARHPVHAEGQVLVSRRDVIEQHGVGPDVPVGGCHTED